MKVIALISALALTMPGAYALAQSANSKGMDMKSMPAEKKAAAKIHKATGVVKSVDVAKGTVTLAHGAVTELKWPAMTMPFMVKDKKLFDRLAANKQVEFEFVQQGSDYVVTTVK
jgi:Cu(I)/Ag(I) efflux system periplasmic protein CusF